MVNWTVAIPALGLALGPLIWSSPADILGRRFIFILGTAIALASTIGAGVATTYGGYMAARLFQGLGVSPAATVGLAIINDLFFEHERGEKVGLWVLAIDTGLLVGPLIGGFIQVVDYKWVQWLTAILFGIVLVAELLFMPETLYPRDFMLAATARAASAPAASSTETTDGTVDEKKGVLSEPSEKPSAASEAGQPVPELPAEVAAIKRTKTLPYVNVLPVPALKYPKPWDSVIRFLKTFKFVVLPISIGVFCFGWYW